MTNHPSKDRTLDNTQEFIVASSQHDVVARERRSSYPYFSEGEPTQLKF